MDSLARLANGLDQATAACAEMPGRLTYAIPVDVVASLGGEAEGRLGEVGGALAARWLAALRARELEAGAVAARLAEAATAVRSIAAGYAETEQAVRHRHPEPGGW